MYYQFEIDLGVAGYAEVEEEICDEFILGYCMDNMEAEIVERLECNLCIYEEKEEGFDATLDDIEDAQGIVLLKDLITLAEERGYNVMRHKPLEEIEL